MDTTSGLVVGSLIYDLDFFWLQILKEIKVKKKILTAFYFFWH